MSTRANAITTFLSRIEQAEARLLAWGLVDGSFIEDELLERADTFLTQEGLWNDFESPDELITQLEDDHLLFTFLDGIRVRYRTRMAEAIRLLARLRQLFPRHLAGRQWQTADRLLPTIVHSSPKRVSSSHFVSGQRCATDSGGHESRSASA